MLGVGLVGLAIGVVLGSCFRVGVLFLAHTVGIAAALVAAAEPWASFAMAAGSFVAFSLGCQIGYAGAAASLTVLRHRPGERFRLGIR